MHQALYRRLKAIAVALRAVHGDAGPAAIAGHVREVAIRTLILPTLPAQYRITSGQIIDQFGRESGQLDAIIENGQMPSLAAPSLADLRMVLAEGASSVIEIKSSLPSQWAQVRSTRDKLAPLRREFHTSKISRGEVPRAIPFFVLSYKGWSEQSSIIDKVDEAGVSGILVLQPHLLFAGRIHGPELITATEENALWAFICALHFHATQVVGASCDLFAYGRKRSSDA